MDVLIRCRTALTDGTPIPDDARGGVCTVLLASATFNQQVVNRNLRARVGLTHPHFGDLRLPGPGLGRTVHGHARWRTRFEPRRLHLPCPAAQDGRRDDHFGEEHRFHAAGPTDGWVSWGLLGFDPAE